MWKHICAVILTLAMSCGAASAAGWPERPINVIVPFAAGGPTDQLARKIAEKLANELGQPVVIVNSTGASGAIGMAKLAKAPADGYTVGLSAYSMMAIAPYLSKLPYDTVKDFTPIATIGSFPYVLVVDGKSPINSIEALINKARKSPGTVAAASAGVGTGTHLAISLLAQDTGVTFNDIQYKGSNPITPALMGGYVDFTFMVLGGAVPLIEAGQLKGIATTGEKRHALFTTLPTVRETYPEFTVNGWYAFFGPAGMPADITTKLNGAITKVLGSGEMKDYLVSQGYDTMVRSPVELAGQIQIDLKKWGKVIQAMPASAQKGM